MSDGFFVADEFGLPDYFVDPTELVKRARLISLDLVHSSRDPQAVADIISEKIMATGETADQRLLVAAALLDQLTSGVVGPLLTLAEQTDPEVQAVMLDHSGVHEMEHP